MTPSGIWKPYSPDTIWGWFRVLRTITKVAVRELGLSLDPTLGIGRPRRVEEVDAMANALVVANDTQSNSVSGHVLVRFLAQWDEWPQHRGLVQLLARTGLRFCHASATKWADWDRSSRVLVINRKQSRGVVEPKAISAINNHLAFRGISRRFDS